MKIVFVDDRVYAHLSGEGEGFCGAERQQWLLARALVSVGWSATFGVASGLGRGERVQHDGVDFVGIGSEQPLKCWHRFLVSEEPDWWYWRGAYHLWGPGVEIARLAGVRTIFAAAFDRDVQPRRALSFRPRLWPLYAWGLSRTDRIFLQHGGQLANLRHEWQSKASIVFSIAGKTPPGKPHPERSEYVAWVGMLRQPKRPDLLIDIAKKTPDVRFVACGAPARHRSAPGYGERVVEAFRGVPNIEYLGRVAPDKAHQVIAEASILLSTSDEEGFPNTFLQAWSSGTPVVSLTIDPDRVIQQKGLGSIAGDVANASATIYALMGSPLRRDAMGARAVRHVSEAHSEESVVATFNQAIREGPHEGPNHKTPSEAFNGSLDPTGMRR